MPRAGISRRRILRQPSKHMLCLLAVGVVAIGQQRVPARKIREGEFSNAESVETKFPALSRRICHQADSSTVVRRFFRGTASLYIFSILFSRKSRVPLDAAFSYLFLFIPRLLFLPQGLFLPLRCISILLFCAAGIISSAQIHLYLALFLRRDDFGRPDSSLSCSFSPQGLFLPPGFIPSLLFSPQRLFLPPGFIPSLLFFSAGIIATARIHPQLAFFFRRDYFFRPDSSLSCFFVPQG